ncbi:MAG: hypothetical protein IJQ09_03385, partial [Prevotella sp.]|nr:hypothetical protein [Prevotella sp.]
DAAWQLSPEQQELLGQGVDFSTTMADLFVTRTTYHPDGSFNEGDQMRIFRQYATDETGTTFDKANEIYRTYYLKANYAAGTSATINSDWCPKAGKLKYDGPNIDPKKPVDQDSGDSLTWENGRTVRFRAWGRSNLSDAISSSDSYYPDYTVSDWVTVSGPTQNIPLTMRHIACRIALTPKSGNQFSSVELCINRADYDNDDDYKAVVEAYNKMCMPAGVDDETFQLTAMTQTRYQAGNLQDIEKSSEGIVKIGAMSADSIATYVQHPMFKNNNGNQYLISIPVDMSREHAGAELVLPACTRFKVWLYDVNGNDKSGNGKHEAACHVFNLNEIVDGNKNIAFPNGITLKAGYSYTFSVGYEYQHFSVTTTNNFSWKNDAVGIRNASGADDNLGSIDYSWFGSAFDKAAEAANTALANNVTFQPEFVISSREQFLAFTHLVNGSFTKPEKTLTRGDQYKTDGLVKKCYWKYVNENGDTIKLTRKQAEERGYLFYYQFHKSVVDQDPYISEELLDGPFDFNDKDNKTKFKVSLAADLDLVDWLLPSIGTNSSKPFCGVFDGGGHTLKNVNMSSGYLFDNVSDAAITNLAVESVHAACLLRSAKTSGDTGWGCYIAGISMLCSSSTNAIAESLVGSSYVVGCIHVGSHVGTTGGALVGTASNLTMLGCMQTAAGIEKNTGALLGAYHADAKSQFFTPQAAGKLKWGSFMCNYYDVEQSPSTNAVGSIADNYLPQQYIRGSKSHILKAKNDYMIGSGVKYSDLKDNMKKELYGLAPWRAMNYAIWMYNSSDMGKKYPCTMWYQSNDIGYNHLYPTMYHSNNAPDNVSTWNPLEQNN